VDPIRDGERGRSRKKEKTCVLTRKIVIFWGRSKKFSQGGKGKKKESPLVLPKQDDTKREERERLSLAALT